MPRHVVTCKQNSRSGSKVKTGCATCRIRKVKCDEEKPFCLKCVNTGRTCDGYKSPFRSCTGQSRISLHTAKINSDDGVDPTQSTLIEITPQEIDILSRCFSTKTVFNVNLGCDEEARQVLQASLADPSVRYAVSSLRALREDFETSADSPPPVTHPTLSYDYGLQQYSKALHGLASSLSSPSSNGLKSALLCCQIFISIEQVQGNFTAMAQHIIRGLRIMNEYGARPYLNSVNKLIPAHNTQLPLLDAFIVKLFAAPCKFADPSATGVSGITSPLSFVSPHQGFVVSRDHRKIAPDMRTELTRIAASTLRFLSKVSRVEILGDALRLVTEKTALLNSLRLWLDDLELLQTGIGLPGSEPISVSFMRLFHIVLKIVLLGTLNSSPDLNANLQTECDKLQHEASIVGERLKGYKMGSRTSDTRQERLKVP